MDTIKQSRLERLADLEYKVVKGTATAFDLAEIAVLKKILFGKKD